jgi:hypothetical protein
MTNAEEQTADTHPTDPGSLLRLIDIRVNDGKVSVAWQGGVWAWQYLESRGDVASTAGPWRVVSSNAPPTSVTTNMTDPDAAGPGGFYRVRAARP